MTLTGRRTRSAGRDLRIDAVRGVALVSMYLAHCAPTAGPAGVLLVTQYATYPLFALLVGVGAALGSRPGARSAGRVWWVGPLVRGAALVVMAQVLDRTDALVWNVLAYLGVLTWLAAPLARARPAVVCCVGLAALLSAPHLATPPEWWPYDLPGGQAADSLLTFLFLGGPSYGGPYQLASMVFFAAVGILLARRLRPREGEGGATPLVSGVATGVAGGLACVAMLGLERAGILDMHAYEIAYDVLVFDAVLVVSVTVVVAALAGRWHALGAPLAAMGAMSLTLYSLQLVWLGDVFGVSGRLEDHHSWFDVGVLVVGSLVVALLWRAVVRTDPWRRGPLEGPVAFLVDRLTRERAHA